MMNWQDRIVVNPDVLAGKPAVRGTQWEVEMIIDLLAEGRSPQQILASYPGLVPADISACLQYATETLKGERIVLAT